MGLRNMVRRNHLSDEVMGVYKKIFEEFGMGESGLANGSRDDRCVGRKPHHPWELIQGYLL